ncbi:hypothetical protein [Paraburkholderia sp. BL25I1N1]|uniref:hypothetical protein n=1 Tax=Paraburkholderia sp. BL25I1N1 TaxID=1938804 RepID=UPI0011B1FEF8|nr:hypothetical protein [Paraburkholderia sp. BL25I1N1]
MDWISGVTCDAVGTIQLSCARRLQCWYDGFNKARQRSSAAGFVRQYFNFMDSRRRLIIYRRRDIPFHELLAGQSDALARYRGIDCKGGLAGSAVCSKRNLPAVGCPSGRAARTICLEVSIFMANIRFVRTLARQIPQDLLQYRST